MDTEPDRDYELPTMLDWSMVVGFANHRKGPENAEFPLASCLLEVREQMQELRSRIEALEALWPLSGQSKYEALEKLLVLRNREVAGLLTRVTALEAHWHNEENHGLPVTSSWVPETASPAPQAAAATEECHHLPLWSVIAMDLSTRPAAVMTQCRLCGAEMSYPLAEKALS